MKFGLLTCFFAVSAREVLAFQQTSSFNTVSRRHVVINNNTPLLPDSLSRVQYHGKWNVAIPRLVENGKSLCSLQASSSTAAAADNSSSNKSPMVKSFFSASLLIALDVAFRRLFQHFAIPFPSSLAGCCALFAALIGLPTGEAMFRALSPGAALLAKWLPIFFVPSLITLPLAGNIGSAMEVSKGILFFVFSSSRLLSFKKETFLVFF